MSTGSRLRSHGIKLILLMDHELWLFHSFRRTYLADMTVYQSAGHSFVCILGQGIPQPLTRFIESYISFDLGRYPAHFVITNQSM